MKWEKKHQHKCPDCGTIFDCPCGKSCGVEYDKYPCKNDIMNHYTIFYTNPQEAMENPE